MLLSIVAGVATALLADGVSSKVVPQRRHIATDVCRAHLVIDDFTSWSNGENLLNGAASGKTYLFSAENSLMAHCNKG